MTSSLQKKQKMQKSPKYLDVVLASRTSTIFLSHRVSWDLSLEDTLKGLTRNWLGPDLGSSQHNITFQLLQLKSTGMCYEQKYSGRELWWLLFCWFHIPWGPLMCQVSCRALKMGVLGAPLHSFSRQGHASGWEFLVEWNQLTQGLCTSFWVNCELEDMKC